MFRITRTSLISSAIIAVLAFSAVGPTIAYADGGTTTDASATQTSSNCEDVPADLRTATNGCSSGGEKAPESDNGGGEAAPADSAPAPDATVLDAVPDNTTITVLNAAGESQPLATQEAAYALTESDPIWCPAGQAPIPGANGCTQSFNSFSDLLNFLSGNAAYSGAGTIYIQQGAYTGGESSIDFNSGSYDLSNIHDFDLTITGGWNTSTNVVDAATTSNFDIPIIIGSGANPWGGSLTISNISISGTTGTGLTVYSDANITVTNVTVTDTVAASGNSNGSGAELDAGGNVTIDNSKFTGNRTSGATIRAKQSVAISNSSFSNPSLEEALHGRMQIKGLDITAGGSVSLFNVLANGNRREGANIVAGDRVTIVQSVFSGTKSINSTFHGFGLQVVTPGIIDLDGVTADDNFLWGALLDAGGDVNIANSQFNANTTESPGFIDDTGLLVKSGGNVSLLNVHADDNRLLGATIDAAGDVSINNSTFSNNQGLTIVSGANKYDGIGLQVKTPGNIFINMVTASGNGLIGAQLNGGLDVILSSSDFSNQGPESPDSTEPLGRGLEVVSGGNIFLDNVTLNNNERFGASLQAAADIYMESVTATGNGEDGVTITSAACTHLIGGTFSGNGGYGVNLGTSPLDQVIAPAFSNNALGNIFPATPASCAPAFPPALPNTGGTPAVPGGAPAASSDEGTTSLISAASNSASGAASFGRVSLSTYLAGTRTGNTSSNGIFIGKYAYVHTLAGLQIFAIVPDTQLLAMRD